jgi:hypothetical protein
MITPKKIIYPSSGNPAEILVVCENDKGVPVNVTVTNKTLGAQFAKVPQQIENPKFTALQSQEQVLVDQLTSLRASMDDVPSMLDNPDFEPLQAQAFAAAEEALNG